MEQPLRNSGMASRRNFQVRCCFSTSGCLAQGNKREGAKVALQSAVDNERGVIMRVYMTSIGGLGICSLLLAAGAATAQEPRPPDTSSAVDATIGNSILQVRYLSESPIGPARTDLDYGLLLSENNDIIASVAMMFDTDLVQVPRLRFRIGPQAYLARLRAPTKTDFFALAGGANARYELIERLGLAVFGSGFYSPGVLTFGSAHNLYDFTAGAEIRFTSRLVGMAGYRWLKVTVVNAPSIRVQNEVFAGLRWQFG